MLRNMHAGHSLVWGVISAMETFCGQAYGANRFGMLGIVLQRSLLIATFIATPCAIAWVWADKLLLLIGGLLHHDCMHRSVKQHACAACC